MEGSPKLLSLLPKKKRGINSFFSLVGPGTGTIVKRWDHGSGRRRAGLGSRETHGFCCGTVVIYGNVS
ncbi:hypothetical protein Y1Q_0015941 [Alligator mississippiensis]|uniref:Uncharacterized protein n=1 Tax=Alligator mississippiensis TaxID=8496 RepID=A0A151MUV4_ALLMI|nr:hypothetical protein Y1Q_0015941 [Alligator mississippiensis]